MKEEVTELTSIQQVGSIERFGINECVSEVGINCNNIESHIILTTISLSNYIYIKLMFKIIIVNT